MRTVLDKYNTIKSKNKYHLKNLDYYPSYQEIRVILCLLLLNCK